MSNNKLLKGLAVALMGASTMANATEGMWQPHQLPQIAQTLTEAGLTLDPSQMQNFEQFPMNAIVSLGGCSASFVSPKGLVVTNHHCVYGSVAYNSTEENNYIRDGFVASSLAQELPARPGALIYVTEEITNVTDAVTGSISADLSGKDYYEQVEKNKKALISACETSKDYRCTVTSFHSGLEYNLIKYLAIRDVRIAYAPPLSIGKFGGDTDNWQWPRHTGDWGFYRAYVGKDGKPADYSEDNVPYTPASFLKVNAKSVNEGDFVMALGYPGSTKRYRTAFDAENMFTWTYPTAKRYREEMIAVIENETEEGSDERIKYQSRIASLANYAKNYGSLLESYNAGTVQERKDALEQDLAKWINSSADRQAEYGGVLEEVRRLQEASEATRERDLLLGYIGQTNLWRLSKRLYKYAHEQLKPDAERASGYQERDVDRLKRGLSSIERTYVASVDKAIMLHFLEQYAALPESQRVSEYDQIFGLNDGFDKDKVMSILDAMHAGTDLHDKDVLLSWLSKSVEEFRNSEDPYIQFAVASYGFSEAQESQSEELNGQLRKIMPKYMQALIAYKSSQNEAIYADANSTLRITFGNVMGYSPKDGLYATPFTTLEGMMAKYVPGDSEFDLNKATLNAIAKKEYGRYFNNTINSVPVNLLADLDTTGGNSGSAILNGDGELVGLLFDGVYESVIADWDYDQNLNRSIVVTSSFMLWAMENIDNAHHLVEEMTVVE